MGYESLVRRSWRQGEFKVEEGGRPDADEPRACDRRAAVEAEMEEIVKRDAGDAVACLTAHREGVMKLAPFVKFREEKFGAVLFETRSEKVYTLSPTGAAVVREILSGADAATLAERLKAKYDDKTGKMAQEALGFLTQLKEKGLVAE
ncbi:MAG: PqqD family protein [Elusimicrobia bacterium]|nr:PqqD family protein [Elusimicrobiota bacterium]